MEFHRGVSATLSCFYKVHVKNVVYLVMNSYEMTVPAGSEAGAFRRRWLPQARYWGLGRLEVFKELQLYKITTFLIIFKFFSSVHQSGKTCMQDYSVLMYFCS